MTTKINSSQTTNSKDEPTPTQVVANHAEIILSAMQSGRMVHFNYTNKEGANSFRSVRPSHMLVYNDGRMILKGYCMYRKKIISFRLDRMRYPRAGRKIVARENVVYPGTFEQGWRAAAQSVRNVATYLDSGWVLEPSILVQQPQGAK